MSWDAFQCEVIDALGYRRYRLADDAPEAVAPVASLPAQAGDPAIAVKAPRDALAVALLRAAGRSLDAGDADALCAGWDLQRLKTPEAKRALWPRLRALRRSPRGG